MHRHTPRSLPLTLTAGLALTLFSAVPVTAQEISPDPSPASPAAAGECVEPEETLAPVTEEPLSMPEEFRIELFDRVWGGIRDFYVDPGTNGQRDSTATPPMSLNGQSFCDGYAARSLSSNARQERWTISYTVSKPLDPP